MKLLPVFACAFAFALLPACSTTKKDCGAHTSSCCSAKTTPSKDCCDEPAKKKHKH